MIESLFGAAAVSEPLLELLVARRRGQSAVPRGDRAPAARDRGDRRRGRASAAERGDVRVPDTINDLIAARIDRLEEPLKQTLARGLRRRAPVRRAPCCRGSWRRPTGRWPSAWATLQTLDFVFLLDQLLYSFKHALTQEVVYGGLLERRRRVYHAMVGATLEELYAGHLDEVVELLAHHFGRSAEAEKAVDYALLAAEKAQRQWAHVEALAQFDAARHRLETMPDTQANRLRRIDAVVKQAEIKFALGRQAEHVQALEAIRDLVESSADPPRRAAWYYWAGFLHSLTGARPEVSIEYCRRAVEIAEASGLRGHPARMPSVRSLTSIWPPGNLGGAIEAGERPSPPSRRAATSGGRAARSSP